MPPKKKVVVVEPPRVPVRDRSRRARCKRRQGATFVVSTALTPSLSLAV